jgi:hypothetical protein
MDRRFMAEMLAERRAIRPLDSKCLRVLFLDNCGGHNDTRESAANLAKIVTEISLLPNESTHVTQPADVLVIKTLSRHGKRAGTRRRMK